MLWRKINLNLSSEDKRLPHNVLFCFKKTKAFNDKCTFFIVMKTFWTVLNNQSMIDAVDEINSSTKAHSISTFDFSSLYYNKNHERLKFILRELMNFCFKGGLENYIAVRKFGARWVDDKKN